MSSMMTSGFVPLTLGPPCRDYGAEHNFVLHHVYNGDLNHMFIDYYLRSRDAPLNYQSFHDRRVMATYVCQLIHIDLIDLLDAKRIKVAKFLIWLS